MLGQEGFMVVVADTDERAQPVASQFAGIDPPAHGPLRYLISFCNLADRQHLQLSTRIAVFAHKPSSC
jgi:hypothetical protein